MPALLAVALLGMVAAFLAPHDKYFLGNLAWYWLPSAAVVVLLALSGAKAVATVGCAVALTVSLISYRAWVASLPRPEGMAWLFFWLALPGSFLGAYLANAFAVRRSLRMAPAALLSGATAALGFMLNMALAFCILSLA